MKAADWIRFSEQLPGPGDADAGGFVETMSVGGLRRMALWNWIPPSTSAARLWNANDFRVWRRAERRSAESPK